jgi:hypothetical protein
VADEYLTPKYIEDFYNELYKKFYNQRPYSTFWKYLKDSLLTGAIEPANNISGMVNLLGKAYNNWLTSIVPTGEFTIKTDTTPWGEMGITEEEFLSIFPDAYKEVSDYYTSQQEGETTDDALVNAELQSLLDEAKLEQESFDWSKEQDIWQRAQTEKELNLALAQNQNERQQADWARQTALSQQIAQTINERIAARSQGLPENLQAEFEKMREDILSSLEPTDWAQKWVVNNYENPYVTQPENPTQAQEDYINQLTSEKSFYESELERLQSKLDDPYNPLYLDQTTLNSMTMLKNKIEGLQRNIDASTLGADVPKYSGIGQVMQNFGWDYTTALQVIQDYAASGDLSKWGQIPELTPQQKIALDEAATQWKGDTQAMNKQNVNNLNIPTWLQPMLAGNASQVSWNPKTQTGNWAEAITPSGQMWGQLNPTQKSLWGSYLSTSGQSAEDLQSQMEQQLPKNLNLGRTWARGYI